VDFAHELLVRETGPVLHRAGRAKNILFETDFPHAAGIAFNEVAETVDYGPADLDASVRERILWRNAAELYGLPSADPGAK
jgi:predicted TIM-barrel fold metal-dependent hydrolase